MADLDFQILGATVVPFAASPQLAFALRLTQPDGAIVHTVNLRCQIQIEVARRRYTSDEQARVADLFGQPDRWSRTLRTMLWTHASVVVPRFSGETTVDVPVACTFDFNVAATKYFHGLEDGDVPLRFLFSGTVFYEDETGALQAAPISWDKEAEFRLPVATWKSLMDAYYPNSAWLSLSRDVFQRLSDFKSREGLATWEEAIDRALLAARSATVSS